MSFPGHLQTPDKVDSRQAAVASSGALQNLTAYLNGTFSSLGATLQGSSEYLSGTLGIPPALVYSSLAALVAVPLTMSKYGWSSSRDQISPYSSMPGGAPAVTDEDYSYITSQDIDDPNLGLPETRPRAHSRTGARPDPEDDVLLIKSKGVIYPTHFPAYSIGDGKLCVVDVRNRICTMMDLSTKLANRIKLLYKGRQLKESTAPVREYGVKNKSEIMAVLPEGNLGGSTSEEEEVIVDGSKSRRRRKKKSKKTTVDNGKAGGEASNESSGAQSPPGPLRKLDELRSEFNDKWLPMCKQFIASPPADPKKKEEEHRRLSESILAQILLKLDGVETEGIAEVRARRKEQVKEAQATLKELDMVIGKERPSF